MTKRNEEPPFTIWPKEIEDENVNYETRYEVHVNGVKHVLQLIVFVSENGKHRCWVMNNAHVVEDKDCDKDYDEHIDAMLAGLTRFQKELHKKHRQSKEKAK